MPQLMFVVQQESEQRLRCSYSINVHPNTVKCIMFKHTYKKDCFFLFLGVGPTCSLGTYQKKKRISRQEICLCFHQADLSTPAENFRPPQITPFNYIICMLRLYSASHVVQKSIH